MEGGIAHNLDAKQRTDDVRIKELAPFSKMLLADAVRKGLHLAGFVYPTVIQATAIPIGKSGLDLLVQSKSGTGKTLIFSTIILEAYRSGLSEAPQSLVLAPTREIAVQIEAVLNQIGRACPGFRAVCVIGGLDIGEDRKRLQGAKSVVGTPGRLLHLIQNEVLNTSQIRLLVLDEADKMYSQSFRQDLQRIQKALPSKKQTIACSATFCNDLDKELAKIMRNPLLISTEDRATLLVGIKQFAVELPEQKTSILEMQAKLDALRDIFGRIPFKQCLIFAGSQSRADSYRNYLEKEGWPCELISGAQDQRTRLEMFKKFREFKTRILLATDLMSRGVDSEHVNLVINLELPTDVVTYLHRIGRAGRFGSHGIAISFVANEKDRCTFKRLITQVGNGMNVLKFPQKSQKEDVQRERDVWNFSNFVEECQHYGLFGQEQLLAPLASQDQASSSASLSDSQENKENQAESHYNSNSSIDTQTFRIDSKDSALNVMDLAFDRPDHNLPSKLTVESRQSSSQQLPSSNTIDDASSIAADSLRSSQQDISRYQSLLMQKVAIPTLVEFLVDRTDHEESAAKKNKPKLDLFEDYKLTVLDDTEKSLNEAEIKSDEQQLTANKLADFKSLLIDKPQIPSPNITTKHSDIYSDYANFNGDDDSTSISQSTGIEDIDKATFILSVATPSNPPDFIEELQNSSLDLSQADTTSETPSAPEARHFPSPVHNQSSILDVIPPRQGLPMLSTQVKHNLTVSVGAQIEIPPYQSPISISPAVNVVALEGNVSPLPSGSEEEVPIGQGGSQDSGSSTERGAISSGFDEKTTSSASSGIETSEAEGEEFEIEYQTSEEDIRDDDLEDTLYDDDDDESNVEEYVETDDESENKTATENINADNADKTPYIPQKKVHKNTTANDEDINSSGMSQNNQANSYNLAYQSAYTRWVDMYWNQMTLVQDYVKMCSFMRTQRNEN